MLFYKETAFGLYRFFLFHQWGIPHCMCRFYLLLAGAVGKRQGISIPYPSPTPLLTPLGIRCGGAFWLPRWTGIQDSCIRCGRYSPAPDFVQLSVFGSVSFAFQSGCPAYVVRFSLVGRQIVCPCGCVWDRLRTRVFHWWGRGCMFLRRRLGSVGLLFFSALLAPHYSVTDSILPWPVAVWSL